MQEQTKIQGISRKLLTTKSVFTVTLIVVVMTILSIWLFGLGYHRTLFENSILSTSILSLAFFLFLSIGLYRGIKLKDDIGKLTDKLNPPKRPNFNNAANKINSIDIGNNAEDLILGIVMWVVVTILVALFIWFFGAVIWTSILIFIAMLYWIFFRALRLVFKNSNKCKGNLTASVAIGLGYTALYNFWIYGIILTTHYLIK